MKATECTMCNMLATGPLTWYIYHVLKCKVRKAERVVNKLRNRQNKTKWEHS